MHLKTRLYINWRESAEVESTSVPTRTRTKCVQGWRALNERQLLEYLLLHVNCFNNVKSNNLLNIGKGYISATISS